MILEAAVVSLLNLHLNLHTLWMVELEHKGWEE
jgi:hypothetical protein